jgi:hypothetical protein
LTLSEEGLLKTANLAKYQRPEGKAKKGC